MPIHQLRRYLHRAVAATALAALLPMAGCRKEIPMIRSEAEYVTSPTSPERIEGFFLVNEGNMGSNKCTIDHFNARTGGYQRNIYPERNPDVVKELGDVGNDIAIHKDRLYVVVNCSNLVEVMDVHTAEHIGSISIPNCRYTSSKATGLTSAPMPARADRPRSTSGQGRRDRHRKPHDHARGGCRLPARRDGHHGRPALCGQLGGYRFPNYDRTVSVVDLESLEVVNTIDVAINLHRMELDRYGRIYVSSRGNYYGTGSDIYVIDAATEKVIGNLGIAASEMCIDDDRLYTISTEWSYTSSSNEVSYAVYDTAEQRIVSHNFITDGTEKEISLPYGLAVNPETKEIFVCDATNYVTPGYLYCFTPEGTLKWKVRTGDIPAHIAFSSEPYYY